MEKFETNWYPLQDFYSHPQPSLYSLESFNNPRVDWDEEFSNDISIFKRDLLKDLRVPWIDAEYFDQRAKRGKGQSGLL